MSLPKPLKKPLVFVYLNYSFTPNRKAYADVIHLELSCYSFLTRILCFTLFLIIFLLVLILMQVSFPPAPVSWRDALTIASCLSKYSGCYFILSLFNIEVFDILITLGMKMHKLHNCSTTYCMSISSFTRISSIINP